MPDLGGDGETFAVSFALDRDENGKSSRASFTSVESWARGSNRSLARLLGPQQKLAADNPKFSIEHDMDGFGVSDVLLLEDSCG